MELVYSIIFLIIGYGFGSFSTGYVVGRMSVDLPYQVFPLW